MNQNLILIALMALAGHAVAQPAPTAAPEPTVSADVNEEGVKGAGRVFGALEKSQAVTSKMNAAMLKRRDACVALARAGQLGAGAQGNGAMAQYKCLLAGKGKP